MGGESAAGEADARLPPIVARFWIAAAFMLVCFVITWFATAKPAKRIVLPEDKLDEDLAEKRKSYSIKQVLISSFGLYLLILILSSIGNNGINAQIANILPNVYGIDSATTSSLISLAGLLNIVFFIVAGAWLGRSSSMPVFTTGNIIRFVGALLMAMIGLMAKAPILLAAAAIQSTASTNFCRITASGKSDPEDWPWLAPARVRHPRAKP